MTSVIPETSTATSDPTAQRPHTHLSAAVHEALATVFPELASPELAAQIATDISAELAEKLEAEPPTATTRITPLPAFTHPEGDLLYAETARACPGEVSISSYGNGTLYSPTEASDFADRLIESGHVIKAMAAGTAEEQSRPLPLVPLAAPHVTLVHDYGFGAHRTTPIETEAREITDGPAEDIPWLAAEIVVNDYRSQAYGRHTELWLHNNRDTAELTVDQARAQVREARAFLDRFEALIDYAETVAAGDFEGDPEVYAAEREAEDRRIKARTEELLARDVAHLTKGRA